jgi:hypothetical protein
LSPPIFSLVTVPPFEFVLGMIIALVLEPELIDMLEEPPAEFVYFAMSEAVFCAAAQPASSVATSARALARSAARLNLWSPLIVVAARSRA